MAYQIYVDEGLVYLLKNGVSADLKFRLFTNNVTPTRTTVLTDLVEASWTGYAAQTKVLADWTTSYIVADVATIQSPDVAFSNSSGSPQSSYGWYVTDNGNSKLLWISRWDGAPVSQPSGDTVAAPVVFGGYSAQP